MKATAKTRIIFGVNPVIEAIRAAPKSIEKILLSSARKDKAAANVAEAARAAGIRLERTGAEAIEKLAGSKRHQGVAAVMAGPYAYAELDGLVSVWKRSGERAFFLILDSVQDPQNLGSLVRAATAAGAHGVIIPKHRASQVTPAVTRASAGATAHMPIAQVTNIVKAIEILKKEGVWVYGLAADAKSEIYDADLTSDAALVVGGESGGIRKLVRERCDQLVSIPMAGKLDSLNAAQAGTVAMFELKRRRAAGG
jgi:23S rRNA (guanosine2251-2'-O)-methyltransferase